MVDSETHVRLAPVSRRAVLVGGIATPLLPTPSGVAADAASDPILPLWTQWQCASAEAAIWGTRWAALERELARTVGFPRVCVSTPDYRTVWATSFAQIDEVIGDGRESETSRTALQMDLASRQASWTEAATQTGLDVLERQEAAAMARSAELAETLLALSARTLAGVIVKLELILRMGETHPEGEDFPWGCLRATVAELKRLTAEFGIPLPP